jgi:hypothetical protein
MDRSNHYSLSQTRLYEVLCGMCLPNPQGKPISGIYQIDQEGPQPTIVVDHSVIGAIDGGTWLDVVRNPEIARVSHARETNTVYVEMGEHIRGEKTAMAAVDRAYPAPPAHLESVRRAMGTMQFATKRSPLPGLPGGAALH